MLSMQQIPAYLIESSPPMD